MDYSDTCCQHDGPTTYHNPSQYIGASHETCWQLVKFYYAEAGITLASDAFRNAELFKPIDDPVDGCLAILGAYKIGGHCGIYHSGRIFHNTIMLGVVSSKPDQFKNRVYYGYCN